MREKAFQHGETADENYIWCMSKACDEELINKITKPTKKNQNFCNSIAVKEYKNEPNNILGIKKKIIVKSKINFQIIKLLSENILTGNI